jgi:hypothetical protein
MPNFGYHLARAKGNAVRATYRASLRRIAKRRIVAPRDLPFDVYSYSGEAALPEQVASIRSFLRHAGRPQKFTVVSDGTHPRSSVALLRSLDPSVTVSEVANWLPGDLPERLHRYLAEHPTGKQLALIMSLPNHRPAFYIDSDVLFFPGAGDLASLATRRDVPAFYQADCRFSGDERLLRDPAEKSQPVNTGVLMLFQALDWSRSIERFLQMEGDPMFFTNQTMTHLTMHANGAKPFDREKFVLELDDQFVFSDRHASREIALRHYVNPVRHKFWTTLPRAL